MRMSIAAVLLLVAAMSAGCQSICAAGNEIVVPSADATAPGVTMDAHFLHQAMVTVTPGTGNPSVSVAGDEVVTLIAAGNDAPGVQDIQIWVEETRTRPDGSQFGPGLLGSPDASNPDSTAPGGKGCTSRLAQLSIDIAKRRVGAISLRLRVWATAVNFGGTKVDTDSLTINWP